MLLCLFLSPNGGELAGATGDHIPAAAISVGNLVAWEVWIKEHREGGNWERRDTSGEGISASGPPCPVIKKKVGNISFKITTRPRFSAEWSLEWFWAVAVGSMGVRCESYLGILANMS